MVERFVTTVGTISIGTGDQVVVGDGTTWSGRDREGSEILAYPPSGAPIIVGTVAAVEPRGVYENLELPLVKPYRGPPLSDCEYELKDGLAMASGAVLAAIQARFWENIEANRGLVAHSGDYTNFLAEVAPTAPNNLAIIDAETKQFRWLFRNGVLEDMGTGSLPEVDLVGVMQLLHNEETAAAEHASSTLESAALRSYTLAANNYDKIKIEAVVQHRLEQDAATRADFTTRIKAAGTTVDNGSFLDRIIADSTAGMDSGGRVTKEISVIIAGGQGSPTALTITAQQTVSNSACGTVIKAFRVYGIKNTALKALVGPKDAFTIAATIGDRPSAGEVVDGHTFTDTITFPDNLVGSKATCRVAPTAEAVFGIRKKNSGDEELTGTLVGTVTFAAGQTVGTLAAADPIVMTAGQTLDFVAPNPRDDTLAGIKISLRGTR